MTYIPPQQAAEFIEQYGSVIKVALEGYSERMGEIATDCQRNYDAISADPQARARLEEPSGPMTVSIMTVDGLKTAAGMFRDCATTADKAYSALTALEDGEDGNLT